MAAINLKRQEIQIKIVYYGPGKAGKTTNLEYISRVNKKRLNANLLKIDSYGDRTLFFDFLPFNMGKIKGFDIRVQLYTVPGQQMYENCRRVVLRGADGIVFVADAAEENRKRNRLSFDCLKKNLALNRIRYEETPLVLQCNKVDLAKRGAKLLSRRTIFEDLGVEKETPCFEASALKGVNVIPTLKNIILQTMQSVERHINQPRPVYAPSPAPPLGAPRGVATACA
ncbi:MAG: GTPase domain-containing protein [Desulfobacterales bacterium]|nr:GTPase domain-containing protein [Desulfobacterales bacterium]